MRGAIPTRMCLWSDVGPVSMTPFSQYKGGWPKVASATGSSCRTRRQAPQGSINNGLMHVADLMPTLLRLPHELSQVQRRTAVPDLIGSPGRGPVRAGGIARTTRTILRGSCSAIGGSAGGLEAPLGIQTIRKGGMGAVQRGARSGGAQRSCRRASDKVLALTALWDAYARENNVVLPSRSVFETLEDQLPPRTPDDPGYPPLNIKRQFVPPADMLAAPRP